MVSVWDLVLLAVGLGAALYWYMTRHYDYWKTAGVPALPGVLPGLGNMWDTFSLKASAGWKYCEFYNQTKGQTAVGLYIFREPALLVRSPNMIQDILISEFSSFHDNAMEVNESVDKHISQNPFLLKGERWKTLRQQINPAFSPSRIKSMFPLIQRVLQEFKTYVTKHANEDINVNQVNGLFTCEVVAKCAFGLDGNALTAADHGEFYQQGRKLWDGSLYNPLILLLFQFFPILNKILRRSFVPKEVTEFFIGLVKQAEDYRIKNPDKVPEDYLQYLLNLKKKNPSFSLDSVVAQSMTFFTDGFETSSIAASFVVYELTVNPEIQEELRSEINNMESFSYDNIVSLDLLDRVFKETLRKYGVFALVRTCTKDHTLNADGLSYPMRKGHQVVIPVHAIQNDPQYYPDPEKFDPDRFLPEVIKTRPPMTFLGFGGGPRMCIGKVFATNLVKVFIADILTNFRLVKCDKTVEKMKLSREQLMPVAESGIWCRFQKL